MAAKDKKTVQPLASHCKRIVRQDWILDWLNKHKEPVDVLNADFVWSFIDAFPQLRHQIPFYGAPKCKQLGRDLASLYKEGSIKRYIINLPSGSKNEGFPGWVYAYELEA